MLDHVMTCSHQPVLSHIDWFQLVEKFSTFYSIQLFGTTFTIAHQLSLSCVRSAQSMNTPFLPATYFLKTHCNIIPHLCLGLPSGLFPSSLPTKYYIHLSSPPYVQSRHASVTDITVILLSAFRQAHSLFRGQFWTRCDLVFPLSISSIFSFR